MSFPSVCLCMVSQATESAKHLAALWIKNHFIWIVANYCCWIYSRHLSIAWRSFPATIKKFESLVGKFPSLAYFLHPLKKILWIILQLELLSEESSFHKVPFFVWIVTGLWKGIVTFVRNLRIVTCPSGAMPIGSTWMYTMKLESCRIWIIIRLT